MTTKLFLELSGLFGGLLALGFVACLPLFNGQVRLFVQSKLFTKLVFWIPIYVIFCLVITGGLIAAGIVSSLLIAQAGREFIHNKGRNYWFTCLYFVTIVTSLVTLPLFFLNHDNTRVANILVTVCFGSALSDVCAFFAGSYRGQHHLPRFINAGKSYEGVLGQIVGAFVGIGLVSLLPEIEFSWQLALIVGVASAVGDLLNSVAKRMLSIKDWGQFIPGHGGVLDRFASLALAIAASWLYSF